MLDLLSVCNEANTSSDILPQKYSQFFKFHSILHLNYGMNLQQMDSCDRFVGAVLDTALISLIGSGLRWWLEFEGRVSLFETPFKSQSVDVRTPQASKSYRFLLNMH